MRSRSPRSSGHRSRTRCSALASRRTIRCRAVRARPTPMSEQGATRVMVTTELQGTIVDVLVAEGEQVRAGAVVALIESMKMHHDVVASAAGTVTAILAPVGTTLAPDGAVIELGPSGAERCGAPAAVGSSRTGRRRRLDAVSRPTRPRRGRRTPRGRARPSADHGGRAGATARASGPRARTWPT